MSRIRGMVGRTGAFVKGRPRAQKVTAVGAVALLVTTPFGGLREAHYPPPEEVRPGVAFEDLPFRITVRKVLTAPDLDDVGSAGKPEPGEQFLLLQLHVRNVTDRQEFAVLLPELIKLPEADLTVHDDVRGSAPGSPMVFQTVDASYLSNLSPDVGYDVSVVYHQRKGWTARTTPVQLVGTEWVEDDPLTLDPHRWRIRDWAGAIAEVDAPVQTLAEALAEKQAEQQESAP